MFAILFFGPSYLFLDLLSFLEIYLSVEQNLKNYDDFASHFGQNQFLCNKGVIEVFHAGDPGSRPNPDTKVSFLQTRRWSGQRL